MEFPTSAPRCHDDQCSDDSDEEREDETEDESGDGSDDDKDRDDGSTPIPPNDDGNESLYESDGNNGSDGNDGAIDRDRGDDEKEQKHLGYRHTRICVRSKKRKRRTRSTSNETGSALSHSTTNDDIADDIAVADEVASSNDISAVELAALLLFQIIVRVLILVVPTASTAPTAPTPIHNTTGHRLSPSGRQRRLKFLSTSSGWRSSSGSVKIFAFGN